jgi:hypothetical protein
VTCHRSGVTRRQVISPGSHKSHKRVMRTLGRSRDARVTWVWSPAKAQSHAYSCGIASVYQSEVAVATVTCLRMEESEARAGGEGGQGHRGSVACCLQGQGQVLPRELQHAQVQVLAPPLQLLHRLRLGVYRRLPPLHTHARNKAPVGDPLHLGGKPTARQRSGVILQQRSRAAWRLPA